MRDGRKVERWEEGKRDGRKVRARRKVGEWKECRGMDRRWLDG